jgi:hypothetical protein
MQKYFHKNKQKQAHKQDLCVFADFRVKKFSFLHVLNKTQYIGREEGLKKKEKHPIKK